MSTYVKTPGRTVLTGEPEAAALAAAVLTLHGAGTYTFTMDVHASEDGSFTFEWDWKAASAEPPARGRWPRNCSLPWKPGWVRRRTSMPRNPEFSDAVVSAAVAAFERAALVKVKDTPAARAKFREAIRHVLREAARAELDEAVVWANNLDPEAPVSTGLSILSEALHTGWRKGCEHPYAPAIHRLISEMGGGWGEYTAWVGWALRESGWSYGEAPDG